MGVLLKLSCCVFKSNWSKSESVSNDVLNENIIGLIVILIQITTLWSDQKNNTEFLISCGCLSNTKSMCVQNHEVTTKIINN